MKTIALVAALLITSILTLPAADAAAKKKGTLYHVVSFKFKETATPAQIKNLEDAFAGLKKKVKEIKSLEWGTNNSPENLNKGFTHCWIIGFNTAEDRDAYLVHPEHKEFVKIVGPIVGDVFVIDFWANK